MEKYKYMIRYHQNFKFEVLGIDYGGLGTVLAENEDYIAVKFPAGRHWSGIGTTSYHHPKVIIFEKVGNKKLLFIGWVNDYRGIIQWDVVKGKYA
jgi:hypothetical protein